MQIPYSRSVQSHCMQCPTVVESCRVQDVKNIIATMKNYFMCTLRETTVNHCKVEIAAVVTTCLFCDSILVRM